MVTAPAQAADPPAKFPRFGVRARLLAAFFGISGFAVVAALAATIAFVEVGEALERVTAERMPAVLASQRLARQAERVVAMAPAILSVAGPEEHEHLVRRIASEVERLHSLLAAVERHGTSPAYLEELTPAVARLAENLTALGAVVAQALEARDRKEALLARLASTQIAIRRLLAPGLLVLEADLARLRRALDGAPTGDAAAAAQVTRLAASVAALQPLQQARFEISAINDALLRGAAAEAPDLEVLAFPLKRSLDALDVLAARLEPRLRSRLLSRSGELRRLAEGTESIPAARAHELAIVARTRALLAENAALSASVTGVVERLAGDAEAEIAAAADEARTVQRWSLGVLAAVVGLALLSSVLIVWLYVGRSLIGRLTALEDAMLAIAAGDLERPIPPAGDDEIGAMARALAVFRDTAAEVRATNLREIAEARRRLTDAIESISEGFSLYDSEDRLVITNSRFREEIYPGIADVARPGTPFAEVARALVARGLIRDAEGREDDWLAERLGRHAEPAGPFLQRQANGRWVQIDERRIEGGGTVAVYTDLTELKLHEEALAEKTRTLERLSSQLAKYLSPQVYQSIFSGRQEVAIAATRKKLTVFLSDIAGFTGTADRLESEELTQLLNHYLTEMSRIALAHGATIDKYMGDAILIFFGDPESRGVKEDALACVRMAIAMRERLDELAAIWRASGIEKPFKVRMGIHTGFCTVGNFGSEDRMDYTIIGGAVNTASRLEAMAAPGEILISYETWALVKDAVLCEPRGKIEVKGIAYPIATYRVIDTYERLARERRHLAVDRGRLRLELDLDGMSEAEREEAAGLLRRALAALGGVTAEEAGGEGGDGRDRAKAAREGRVNGR